MTPSLSGDQGSLPEEIEDGEESVWGKGPEIEDSKELLGADPRPVLLESLEGMMQRKARKVAGADVKDLVRNK